MKRNGEVVSGGRNLLSNKNLEDRDVDSILLGKSTTGKRRRKDNILLFYMIWDMTQEDIPI